MGEGIVDVLIVKIVNQLKFSGLSKFPRYRQASLNAGTTMSKIKTNLHYAY